MEISPRKPSKRSQEPVDDWLQSEGYFRKLSPRDPTCLFRAISEQIYLTQYYHLRVRKECVNFMRKMRPIIEEANTIYLKLFEIFNKCIYQDTYFQNISIPFDSYLEQMACFTEWGGMNEIQAMSLLYKREVVVFNGPKQVRRTVTNNGFKDTLYLCYTPQKQYESVYTKDFISTAALCQSIMYQTLYKDVFRMANIENTVNRMLHDKGIDLRHNKFFLKGNFEIREQLAIEIQNKIENCSDVDDVLASGKSALPFPYKVAKALDPHIYRNTDFDIWHEIRREVKNAGWNKHNSNEFQVGGKCLVDISTFEDDMDKANNNGVYAVINDKDLNDIESKSNQINQKKTKQGSILLCGHIQEMNKNEGPVLVFIEELGEKRMVPYSALRQFPTRKNNKQVAWPQTYRKNLLPEANQKCRKPSNTASGKGKEQIATSNSPNNKNDRNNISNNNNNKKDFEVAQWRESYKQDHQQPINGYEIDKCSNYSIHNSIQTPPLVSILDNSSPSRAINPQHKIDECKENIPAFAKRNAADDTPYCVVPYMPGSYAEITPDNHVDHSLRTINCALPKSLDINGNDLPLSDPLTVKFFYNLGLEYFRVTRPFYYGPNGQPIAFGPWCHGPSPNENDMQSMDNNENELDPHLMGQNNYNICATNVQDNQLGNCDIPRNKAAKDQSYFAREKSKEEVNGNRDNQRMSKPPLAPRFKKNNDSRYRNNSPQMHQQTPLPMHQGNQYPHNTAAPNVGEVKNENVQTQYPNQGSQPLAMPPSSPNSHQAQYMQHTVYAGVPFYANETDSFGNPYYMPSPGFLPFPCMPMPEVSDGNGYHSYVQPVFPGAENYAQTYPVCGPYIFPQQTPYSNLPQSVPEHWYAVAGQPQYVQYAHMPASVENISNGQASSVNPNLST